MKRSLVIIFIAIASVALTAGVVKAASAVYDTLTIGRQGTGGVTYFNGTMKNNTTGANNADNPVTIGDNVRIDGRVYRGATAGTGDSLPFIVNDNLEVAGSSTVNGNESVVGTSTIAGNASVGGNLTVTGSLTFGGVTPAKSKTYSGTIDLTLAGDEVVTTADGACAQPTDTKNSAYHYKLISVPELNMDTAPGVRVFAKTPTTGGIVAPPWIPQSGEVWSGASYAYYNTGVVYLGFKIVTTICNGTIVTANFMTGPYRISIVY
ncbi:MAG: hypothetical protein V1668_03915 [Patescibacteria group bacterium]